MLTILLSCVLLAAEPPVPSAMVAGLPVPGAPQQPPAQQVAAEEIQLNAYQQGLVTAGLRYPGAAVCQSQLHPDLCRLAQEHANYMASVCQQGHQNFDRRFNIINRLLGGTAREICAESWPWQRNDSPEALGREMFWCWQRSPGHWSVASQRHATYGVGMAMGRNGIHYACIIASSGGGGPLHRTLRPNTTVQTVQQAQPVEAQQVYYEEEPMMQRTPSRQMGPSSMRARAPSSCPSCTPRFQRWR